MKDFGYDVADYCDVDPLFGTLSDFDRLLERAHALGLKVMIDQVLSHCSDQHPWFVESRQSRDNPKAEWYVWADPQADGSPPNNWLSVFGGSSWQWDARRRQYYLHNFLTSQPDLNFHHPDVQQAHLDNMRFWLERGVDGFRSMPVIFIFTTVLCVVILRPLSVIPRRCKTIILTVCSRIFMIRRSPRISLFWKKCAVC
jgi:alpha-glucosidase